MSVLKNSFFTLFVLFVTTNAFAGAVSPNYDPALDADSDYLMDSEEATLGTDPNDADSDNDGITDFDEVNCTQTDPLDFNECHLFDEFAIVSSSIFTDCEVESKYELFLIGEEIRDLCPDTIGTGIDSDSDLIPDDEETNYHPFTDPNNADTDGDGINDFFEQYCTGTSPSEADTDGDGSSDCEELLDGYYYIYHSVSGCTLYQTSEDQYAAKISQNFFHAPCELDDENTGSDEDPDESTSSSESSGGCSLNPSAPSQNLALPLFGFLVGLMLVRKKKLLQQ